MATVAPDVGYSGTPLPRKLGFKDGQAALFVGLPPSLAWLRDSAGFVTAEQIPDVSSLPDSGRRYDVIHVFVTRRADLETSAMKLMAAIKLNGVVWVSWPKKAAKVPTDITEDTIREVLLPTGLVDNKVAAVDAVWSGLRLAIRSALRETLG